MQEEEEEPLDGRRRHLHDSVTGARTNYKAARARGIVQSAIVFSCSLQVSSQRAARYAPSPRSLSARHPPVRGRVSSVRRPIYPRRCVCVNRGRGLD